jgi:hypothetical protein
MKPTEEQFLKDVAVHEMRVIHDDGLSRHLRFSKPNSGDMRFDLLTWPGHLCYTGDMGTFVFSRVPDMFTFFRTSKDPVADPASKLYINPQYWSEKVLASDRCDGLTRYSKTRFREAIKSYLGDDADDPKIMAALAEEVFPHEENEHEARRAVSEFKYEERYPLEGFWEANLHEYTFRFIWCCYALVWGIRKYDAYKVDKVTVS